MSSGFIIVVALICSHHFPKLLLEPKDLLGSGWSSDNSLVTMNPRTTKLLQPWRFNFVEELWRENKWMLDRPIRDIERKRQSLQNQEKKLITEIKKTAKQGQMTAVKVMAKDLIRTRHQITKFYAFKFQLQGVSLIIQTLKSTQAMGEAMKGVTKAMGQMNRQMNLPALQKIMQEFEKQNEKMEMVSDVMGDAIEDALQGDEDEERNRRTRKHYNKMELI